MPLLTLLQQNSVKAISQNWANATKQAGGVTNFDQLAQEVEDKELRILLGVALLQDVQKNPTSPANVILLDGGTFTDCNGNDVDFKGLRYILAFLNWSKYIGVSKYSDTYTGMVSKNRDEAESISPGDVKRLAQDSREISLQEFELVKDFLNENSDTYPLWVRTSSRSPYTPKFKAIKRTKL